MLEEMEEVLEETMEEMMVQTMDGMEMLTAMPVTAMHAASTEGFKF